MQRFIQIEHGTNVVYHSAYVQRKTAFWYASAGNHLYHGLFIAGRVEGWHLKNFDVGMRTVNSSLQRSDFFFVFAFECDDFAACADMSGGSQHCFYDLISKGTAQIFVCLDQRFTFRCIYDKVFGFRIQLHVRWETGAAGPYDTCIFYCINKTQGHTPHFF